MKWRSALLEALAVLAGVLGAFSIDAWWDEAQETARAEAYLGALAPEVEANLGTLEVVRSIRDRQVELADGFLTRASEPEPVPADSLLEYLGVFGPVTAVPLDLAALSDMLGSGGLSLVRDHDLRRSIAAYDRAVADLRMAEAQESSMWENVMFPFHLVHLDLRAARLGSDAQMVAESMDSEPFEGREYANILLARRWHVSRVRDQMDDVRAQGAAVLARLGVVRGG